MNFSLPDIAFDFWSILFLCFCLVAAIQLLYVLVVFSRLAFYKEKEKPETPHPVTVIIAARNEADNIFENLPMILEQDYPEFEVFVIVNQSSDKSNHILDAYQKEYSNLRYTVLERNKHLQPGKKLPVTIGVKGAKYDHLIFTDADCMPASTSWLREIASRFSKKKEIVLGYGPYAKEKTFLNKVIRFDTAWIGVSYLSFALAKIPYMGVGRNLAYTKSVFMENSGFKSHYYIASGDDDLFIQEVTKNKNYTICISSESFMFSEGEKTWKNWFRQKSRHYTTSGKYKVIKRLLLGIYPLSLLLLYFSFVYLLLNVEFRFVSLVIMVFTVLLKWIIQGKCLSKLQEKMFIPFLPIIELLYTILLPIMYYSVEKKASKKW